jgi:hypothetical protein
VIDEDSEKKKDVLDAAHEDRERTNNKSNVNRKASRRLREKIMQKIYQELYNAAVHELSSIRSRDKILSNAHHVRNMCENSSNQ